uniref:Testis-expressed sequence 9 protein-like n=1 Tax=Phallusia mammillata TaxID=59560 RepID=A0A6F9DU00_9ASCI|nr:testis-expressed sequence 9 protein-like [Phallusia mammillata]
MSKPPSRSKSERQQFSDSLSKNLQDKEEEYQKLNADLEAQTAKLVEEADTMMRQQEDFLNHVSPPRVTSSKSPVAGATGYNESDADIVNVLNRDTGLLSIAAGAFDEQSSDEEEYFRKVGQNVQRKSMPPVSATSSTGRKSSSASSYKKTSQGGKRKPKMSAKSTRSAADDVAIPQDFSFTKSLSNIEKKMSEREDDPNRPSTSDALIDDVMPQAATEMGAEAQIRFLKAKARVLQEELEASTKECQKILDDKNKLQAQLKEAQEESDRVKKNLNLQQTSIQKLKNAFEDEKKNSESKSIQLQAAVKEVDVLKREQKQITTSNSATEVRLNRALEEVDKLKSQLHKQKFSGKEASDRDLREIDKLRSENKRHERMRNDSLAVMKKQQKLIGVLKRQVLHIEAAKLLSFTEEEFVKALDWGDKQ